MDVEAAATRATYDKIADEFASRTSTPWPGLPGWIRAFAQLTEPNGIVLDVGCGPGRDAHLLTQEHLQVVGLDLSAPMLALAGSTPVAQADMRHLPIGDVAIDGVWSQAAILHVPRRDTRSVLNEFRRVLVPGGALCLMTDEGTGEGSENGAYGEGNPRWFVQHQQDRLVDMVSAAGFEIVREESEETHRRWIRLLAQG